MPKICILGLLSYESPKYWNLCKKSIDKTKSGRNEIEYLIGLDRVNQEKSNELIRYIPEAKIVDVSIFPPNRKETTHEKRVRIGSLYNNLLSHFTSDADYLFILDSDIAFVKQGWDDLFISELKDNIIAIGHEYGNRWPQKYQNFPVAQCFFANAKKMKDIKVNFQGHGKKYKISSKADASIFGLKKGDELNRDIGWELPKKIKEAGFDAKIMQFVYGEDERCQLLKPTTKEDKKVYKINTEDNIKSLFEIHFNNEIIATHLTKSTCLKFNEHIVCKYWIQKVCNYLGIVL